MTTLQEAPPQQLLYAQVREDVDVDLQALKIQSEDHVLAVTSGGCTALRLLAEGPASLTCVDFNPLQNYLLELKLRAIQHLPLEASRSFLGVAPMQDRWGTYRTLQVHLSKEAQTYWDAQRTAIQAGVVNVGKTERMCRLFSKMLFICVHSPKTLNQLFMSEDLEQQRVFYNTVWNTRRWRWLQKMVFNPMTFRSMYGKRFSNRLSDDALQGEWLAKIEKAFVDLPIKNNYFLSQFLGARFLPTEAGIPPYLHKTSVEKIKAYADRLQWHTANLQEFLAQAPKAHFAKATLSNALEWFEPEVIQPLFSALGDCMVSKSRVVLRHLLGMTHLPDTAPFVELEALSTQLTEQERAFLYCWVSVYERA